MPVGSARLTQRCSTPIYVACGVGVSGVKRVSEELPHVPRWRNVGSLSWAGCVSKVAFSQRFQVIRVLDAP